MCGHRFEATLVTTISLLFWENAVGAIIDCPQLLDMERTYRAIDNRPYKEIPVRILL